MVQQSRTGPGGGCGDVGWMFPLEVLDGVSWSGTYRLAFIPSFGKGGSYFLYSKGWGSGPVKEVHGELQ